MCTLQSPFLTCLVQSEVEMSVSCTRRSVDCVQKIEVLLVMRALRRKHGMTLVSPRETTLLIFRNGPLLKCPTLCTAWLSVIPVSRQLSCNVRFAFLTGQQPCFAGRLGALLVPSSLGARKQLDGRALPGQAVVHLLLCAPLAAWDV